MNHYFSRKRVQVGCIVMGGGINWRAFIQGRKYQIMDGYVMIFA